MTIAILMGSKSDFKLINPACKFLKEMKVPFEVHVISAHRTPEKLRLFMLGRASQEVKIFIAAAGGAAHLAGAISAQTIKPVIGIPIHQGGEIELRQFNSGTVPSQGISFDSLLSTVQMPPGVPVATVGVNAAKNAAILACQMLALSDGELTEKLKLKKIEMQEEVEKQDKEVKDMLKFA